MASETTESRFFHPSVTADIVALKDLHIDRKSESITTKVLLIKRADSAKVFPGAWALPGGFMDESDESIAAAAVRELQEETGITPTKLKLLGTFTEKGRDPRGPVHSTAFLTTASADAVPAAGDDASEAKWFDVDIRQKDDEKFGFHFKDADGMGCMLIEAEEREDRYGMETYDIVKLYSADGRFSLAFDHDRILVTGLMRLCADLMICALIERDERQNQDKKEG